MDSSTMPAGEMTQSLLKPAKPKKIISYLDSIQFSINEDVESLKSLYLLCAKAVNVADGDVSFDLLDLNKGVTCKVPTNDQAVQVGDHSPAIRNDTTNSSPSVPSITPAPAADIIFKIEDSSSEDSNHREEACDLRSKTDLLIHKMMIPAPVAPLRSYPHVSKDLLHYVIVENLPHRITKEEVKNELVSVGISEDMEIHVVGNQKTESICQLYLRSVSDVQKIIAFSGKLVVKGRVISSRIGYQEPL